jgi:predicted HNH restriction endonuclease
VVFVARDRRDNELKVVGVYASATTVGEKGTKWLIAKTDFAERIPIERRPIVNGWPGNQGMRRWARRDDRTVHEGLLKLFNSLTKALISGGLLDASITPAEDDEGFEGEVKKRLVKHRNRERKKRTQKIAEALRKNNRLICEVPRCGFDFHERYGELGVGFAEVHHKKPLSEAPRKGMVVKLTDLAIVCANCHRMIHYGGQCRSLDNLIPSKSG